MMSRPLGTKKSLSKNSRSSGGMLVLLAGMLASQHGCSAGGEAGRGAGGSVGGSEGTPDTGQSSTGSPGDTVDPPAGAESLQPAQVVFPPGSGGMGGVGAAAIGGSGGSDDAANGGSAGSEPKNQLPVEPEPICGDMTCNSIEDCSSCANDCGECAELPPFGNTDIHPEKISIYMSPDLPGNYTDWKRMTETLQKFHELLPNAWIRWDNETGHSTSTPENVESFVKAANDAAVKMIITASAVDGYDNLFALNFGNEGEQKPVEVSIVDIANGPYLQHAYGLLQKYANVQLVETINEPDGFWFVSDPDNSQSWDYYLDKLYAATNNDHGKILGPSTAFKRSNIWNNHIARPELTNFSYHTYSGWEALEEIPGKTTYVTEYGYPMWNHDPPELSHSPALNMADLWLVEKNNKLDGSIQQIAYPYLHEFINPYSRVGQRLGFSGWLLALATYQSLAEIHPSARLDDAHPDFIASDDGRGHFGVLWWNASENVMSGAQRSIPGTSVSPDAKLHVLRLGAHGAAGPVAECATLAEQDWLTVETDAGGVKLTAQGIDALEAIYVSTEPCARYVN